MTTDRDAAFMRRALDLARRGRSGVHPNPMVGAVLVRDGVVVGEGWHRQYGGAHAEVEALRNAGEAARGATLYVTLEPCAHHGRTPPCVEAITAAGVPRVVIAAADPNPVAGGGAQRLRDAGIDVVEGVEKEAARAQNAAFLHVHEHGAPFIALKLALSLDGRLAARPAERTQITGRAAQVETHALRAAHDVVMIGRVTAQVDDPLLTVRAVDVERQPIRVVIDTQAALPTSSRLVETVSQAPLWVICAADADAGNIRRLEDLGVRVLRAEARTGPEGAAARVDLGGAVALLRAEGVRAVLVEGGAALAGGLLNRRLVHRLYIFVAPRFLGGSGPLAFEAVAGTGHWRYTAVDRVGGDLLMTLDPAEPPVEYL